MASTFEKKFKTTETTKAAGAEVVSDPIELSPRSKDHVLTVTADSSCTDNVNVELEMSPDKDNWCPAVSRTISGGAASSTGDVIGNEESVKLTPDAGEFKNKHARGGLNFDVNGVVVTPDGTGARDLMHQHIATSKSFNYSQWFKTSEAPTTTYKPVLFRHGGYDNFENLKVVDLTDSQTQNLVESKSIFSTQANKLAPAYTGSGGVIARPNTPAATFYGSSGQVDNGAESDIGKHLTGVWNPHEDFSTSRWIFQNNAAVAGFRHRAGITFGYPSINYATSTYIRFYGGIEFSPFVTYSNTDAAEKILPVRAVITGQSGSYWYVYNSNPVLEFTRRSDNTTFTVNPFTGYHVAIAYTAPADITQGIPEANLAMYVNGERVKILTTTENNVDYAYGAAPADALFNGDEGFAHNSNWGGRQFLDYGTTYTFNTIINNHMDFQGRVLSESDILKLYNDGKLLDFSNMQTSFPISLSNCVGAYDADVTYVYPGTSHVQGLEDCSGYGKDIQLMASSVGGCTSSLISPTLSYNATPQNLLLGKFTTGNALSISGWFKTTDTGTLFSNRDSSQGLKVDVTSNGITITHNATTVDFNAAGSVNNGEWHHFCLKRFSNNNYNVIIDNISAGSTYQLAQADTDWLGTNGFTLLSDGDNNAHAASPGTTDASKLNASLSNWSIHGEALSDIAIKQIYSNGHVRNIKNLPSVSPANIVAWWQLNDATNPEQDLAGANDLQYLKTSQTTALNENYLEGAQTSTNTEIDFQVNTPFNPFSGTYSTTMPNLADDFTISMWVYIDGSPSATAVNILRIGNNSAKFGLFHGASSGTRLSAYVASANGDYLQLSGNPVIDPVGSSVHVVVQKSGSTLSLYADGTLVGSGTISISNTNWGEGNGTVDFFELSSRYVSLATGSVSRGSKGVRISDLAFYNSALSSTDISALASKPGAADTVASSNLKTYFKMGDGPNDNIASELVYDTVNYNSSYYIEDTSSTGNATISSLATSDPAYTDGSVTGEAALSTDLVNATGATLVEDSINGNAMTLSLTKSFNFTTNEWVSTADQETALCLSFNGFEEQAEYFALWKCSQTVGGGTIDICDGDWHNVILSYRGKNDLAGDNVDPGDTVKFGPGPANSLAFNWAISYDGEPLTAIKDGSGADYIGGLNTLVTDTYSSTTYNVGFAIQDRHLKYETSNTEEEYKPHAQFSAGIHEVTGVDNNNAFQGYVDETSFHSDTWWVDQAGTSVVTNTFNQEKPATIYGNTTALTNRGASTEYPVGVPYPLLNPEKLNTSGQASDIEGSNQYINPNKYDASTNPNGGLEGWWRWGDTPGDCSITINDVRDHEASINARDISAFGIVTADRQLMTSADSIFNANATASVGGGTTITFPQVKVEGVQSGVCNLKNINSPLLQFVRVKWTGAGSCDLGDGKGEVKLCFTNRRKRR